MDSDAFNTRCPYCLTPYDNVAASLTGKKARCVRCKKTFILQRPSDEDEALIQSPSADAFLARESQEMDSGHEFAPDPCPDDSLLFGTTRASAFTSTGSRFQPLTSYSASLSASSNPTSAEEQTDFSDVADSASTSSESWIDEYAGRFPDPPKGIWRPGQLLLDGMCQVLPLTEDKLYAEGGVGFVQRVRRRDWNIDLIVKSPKPGVVLTESGKKNFERECQTWIELGLHSNIVSCYFVRRIDGIPRLFAELAPDGTLRDWISDRRIYQGTPEIAQARLIDFAIQFAWGLEHAHSQGLLHLDVKPGNVMISGDTVKVTDFGLSKFASESDKSADGMVSACDGMTPSYCSPEQFEAITLLRKQRKEKLPVTPVLITRHSDVWSWAISVWSSWYGSSPCKKGGQTAAEAFELFLSRKELREGGGVRPPMPEGVAEILRSCFRKNPDDRPGSMQFLADQLVRVYEDATGKKYSRRQPKNAALTAESFSNKAISLLDLGKTGEALELLGKAAETEPDHPLIIFNRTLAQWRCGQIPDQTAVRRLENMLQNRSQDATASYVCGLVHMERGNLKTSVRSFERALEIDPERNDVKRSLREVAELLPLSAQCVTQYVLKRTDDRTAPQLYVSDDGDSLLLEGIDSRQIVVSAYTGEKLIQFQQSKAVSGDPTVKKEIIAVSEDFRWSLVRRTRGIISVEPASVRRGVEDTRKIFFHPVDWDACRPRAFQRSASKDAATGKNTSNALETLLFEPRTNSVRISENGALRAELPCDSGVVTAFAASSDGEWFAAGSDASEISVWNVRQRRCARTFQGLGGAVEAIWFDVRKRYVVAITRGNVCQFFNVQLLCQKPEKIRAPHLLCLINSSEELQERQAALETLLKKAKDAAAKGDGSTVVDAFYESQKTTGWESVRPRFETLLEQCASRSDVASVAQTFYIPAHEGAVSTIASSWNGSFLATAGKDSVIRLWAPSDRAQQNQSSTGQWSLKYELTGHSDWIRAIALSPDNRSLVSAAWDQRVLLWDLATGRRLRALPESVRSPSQLVFAPDGRSVVLASASGNVVLWDLATGRALIRTHAGSGETHALAFSRDGRYYATSDDEGLRFWSGRSALPAREMSNFPSPVLSFDLSCDGTFLAAGCANGKIFAVSLQTGKASVLSGHLGEVRQVLLLSDGRTIISAGKDKTIRIWNAESGKEIFRLVNPDGEITSLTADFPGKTFFVGSENGVVRGWNICWNYAEAEPVQIAKLEPVVRTLMRCCANGALGAEPEIRYYGTTADRSLANFDRSFFFSDDVVARICAECHYRGFRGVTADVVKGIVERIVSNGRA